MKVFPRRAFAIVSALALAACGGGDGGSAPPSVATVTLSGLGASLIVGQTAQLSLTGKDGSGNPIAVGPIAFGSSVQAVASVTTGGLVTALTPGTTSISGTASGKSSSIQLTVTAEPVASVSVTPRTASLDIGGSATFSATTFDISSLVLTGRVITWSSSDPTRASVTASGGVATAVSAGNAYIIATSEGKRDSAQLHVRSAVAPKLNSIAPAQLAPGSPATLTGINFSAVLADNEVSVNGVVAPVLSATPTTLTITLPGALALPCTATGPVPIQVVVAGDTATLAHPLSMATPRTLAVGQSLLLTGTDAACSEFAATGGRYLFTVFNANPDPSVGTSFVVRGGAAAPVAATVPAVAAQRSAPQFGPRVQLPPGALEQARAARRAHDVVRETDRRFSATHGRPLQALRSRPRAMLNRSVGAAAPVPAVGDVRTLRMRRTINNIDTFDEISARAVYVGTKMIIFEDNAAPLAGTMDAQYQSIGTEFDATMFSILQNFGDPLAVDAETDADGHIIAVFSKRVNDYLSGLLGFVSVCDFFPPTHADPDQACPASNLGEYFYAAVPLAPTTGTADANIRNWRRSMRSTLVHEAKHIVAVAERISRNANFLEESWLEEATAQQAAEIWSRQVYGRGWKTNIAWNEGPSCDFAAPNGPCGDNAVAILDHFIWLYDFYTDVEFHSILYPAFLDGTIYGSAWSFVRWATDQYGPDEGAFLRALVQQQDERGVANLMARTGKSFTELLGYWSLATLADDYPGFTPADPRLRIPSWNTRSIFMGMSRELRLTSGGIPFPLEFPLFQHTLSFGPITDGQGLVSGLPGGSFSNWELSGTQSSAQAVGVRLPSGGPVPAAMGLAIVRVQ